MANEVSIVFGAVDKTRGVLSGIKTQLIAITGISVSVAATFKLMKDSLAAAGEQGKALRLLETTLISTKGAAGLTRDELVNMADALKRVTAFGDETIVRAEALMLTFRQVGKEVFPGAIESAMDLSTVLGQDLQSSIIQIGKALNDPVAGITALRRVGVSFTKDQREMIEALVESGRVLDAQKIILEELGAEFGGQARAEVKGFGGEIKQTKEYMDDTREVFGFFLQDALRPMVHVWHDAAEGAAKFFEELRMSDIDKAIADLEKMGAAVEFIKELKAVRELEDAVDALPKSIEGATDAYKKLSPWVEKEAEIQARAARRLKETEDAFKGTTDAVAAYVKEENAALTVDLAKALGGVSQGARLMGDDFRMAGVDMLRIRESILAVQAVGDPLNPENAKLAQQAINQVKLGLITLGRQVVELRDINPGVYERVRDELMDYLEAMGAYAKQLEAYKSQLKGLEEAERALREAREGGTSEVAVVVKAQADIDFEKLTRVPDNLPAIEMSIPVDPYEDLFDQLSELWTAYSEEQREIAEEIRGIWEAEVLSEEEQLQLWYDRKLELVRGDAEAEEQLAQVTADRKKRIRDKGQKDELNGMRTFVGAAVDLGRTLGKSGFEAYKAASMAEALIAAHTAAAKAMKEVPFPFNVAAAAMIFAKAMVEVHAIQNQEYGQAHGGLENVPEDATYVLKAGERVLAPDQNKLLMELIKQLAEWMTVKVRDPIAMMEVTEELSQYRGFPFYDKLAAIAAEYEKGLETEKTMPYVEPSAENLAAVEAAFGGGYAATQAWQAILKKSSEYVRSGMSKEDVAKAHQAWEDAQSPEFVAQYWRDFDAQHPAEPFEGNVVHLPIEFSKAAASAIAPATSGPVYPSASDRGAGTSVEAAQATQVASSVQSVADMMQMPAMSQDQLGSGGDSAVIRSSRGSSLAIQEININVPSADGLRRMSTADWLSVVQGPLGQAITEAARRGAIALVH